VRVIAGSVESRDNIARFGRSRGYEVCLPEATPWTYVVELRPGGSCDRTPAASDRLVLIASEQFGSGSEELGRLLMQLLLRSLGDVGTRPAALILVHGGVRLTVDGSVVLDVLRRLEDLGVAVRVCGTCLDYYGLKEQVRVGQISNMFELAEMMMSAESVVRV
jgi:selenium metabolism protein YedF